VGALNNRAGRVTESQLRFPGPKGEQMNVDLIDNQFFHRSVCGIFNRRDARRVKTCKRVCELLISFSLGLAAGYAYLQLATMP